MLLKWLLRAMEFRVVTSKSSKHIVNHLLDISLHSFCHPYEYFILKAFVSAARLFVQIKFFYQHLIIACNIDPIIIFPVYCPWLFLISELVTHIPNCDICASLKVLNLWTEPKNQLLHMLLCRFIEPVLKTVNFTINFNFNFKNHYFYWNKEHIYMLQYLFNSSIRETAIALLQAI